MKRWLTNRWLWWSMGFLALALLIWLGGPLLAFADHRPLESGTARGVTIGLFLLAWAGWEISKIVRARRANRKLLEEIAASDPGEAESARRSREEVAQLKQRFEQAAAILKKAQFKDRGGSSQMLYQLPWYMFIGAPGSGKTTALTRSGLRFPLAEGDAVSAVKGVGGTRNCDWWFTDEAVFLDTAGRYTTQDSDQRADAAAWNGFLRLLKKFRPRSPLNGAIVTVSVADLLTQSSDERIRYATAVRQRIAELYDVLGTRFPIYLLVTKADLMSGFNEYFADMGSEERSQVWGVTFPKTGGAADVSGYPKLAGDAFGHLEAQLNARLVAKLQAEHDLVRRAQIFGFPSQVSLLGPLVSHFIEHAFESSRFSQQPLLRGIYLASGTQEGTPLDRALGSVSKALNLENRIMAPPAGSAKSFFISRLLREVIFAEAGLAGFDERGERRRTWLLRAAFATLAVGSAATVLLWGLSYANNKRLIADTDVRLTALAADAEKIPATVSGGIPPLLALLNGLRALPYGYAERDASPPLLYRFGLFQGRKLGDQGSTSYRRALRDGLLARIELRLEEQMRSSGGNTDLLYEALKAYLMIFDGKHMDPEAFQVWVMTDWGSHLPGIEGRNAGEDFAAHLNALVESRPLDPPLAMDVGLVGAVRDKLAATSLADRVFARLKLLGIGTEVPPFKVSEAGGLQAVQVFRRRGGEPLSAPVSNLFTRAGYIKLKPRAERVTEELASEEKWVLGDRASGGATASTQLLFEEVRKRYVDAYVKEWDRLLDDIQVKPSSSLADTLLYTRILSGADSPLKKLVVAVAKETSLADKSVAKQAEGAVMESVASSAKQLVGKLIGGAASTLPSIGSGTSPELAVEQHFEPLRRLAGAEGQAAPIDALIARLGDFYQELAAMENVLRGSGAPIQGIASAGRLLAEAERYPPPVGNIMKSLIATATGQASGEAGKSIKQGVSGASAFCDKALQGRYPFSRTAKSDVTVEDFTAVLGPGGDLDKHFQSNLAGLVDVASPTWRVRPGQDGAGTLSPVTVAQFQNADTIRKAFFRTGSAAATADIVMLSSDAGSVTLDYDGETRKLAPGGSPIRLKWPAQHPGAAATLTADGSSVVGDGTWALFRLFDRGQIESTGQSDRLKLNFSLGGRKVVLELRATSVLNPFRMRELDSFRCPR